MRTELERFDAVTRLAADPTMESRLAAVVALTDSSALVRHEAAFVLGCIGQEENLPVLLQAMDDESPFVRHEAALAIGQIGDEECLPALQKGALDPVHEVAVSCEYAIARVTSRNN